MICPVCGAAFELNGIYQKYCSKKCAMWANNQNPLPERNPFEFKCGHCGKLVVTAPYKDKRIKFCSRRCQQRAKEQRKELRKKSRCGNGNSGLSGGMSLHSLIRRESRDLD